MALNLNRILDPSADSEYDADRDCYYRILGCSETSTTEQIITEYRIRALKCHPDKNADNPEALKEFQKLQEARDILTDPISRSDYEKWRHCEMTIPYKQWRNMKNRCATTMHWAKPREQTMLEHSSTSDQESAAEQRDIQRTLNDLMKEETGIKKCSRQDWESDKTSNMYSNFRNYKI